MKEQLYTIPLNDAVNAGDECPFCFIERNIEQDLLDFVLGSGSSYMEADIRDMTDKAGFCRNHFQKMFDYGNTLGNAWILKTHYMRMIQEMKKEFADFKPGKTSLKAKLKKTGESDNAIGIWVRKKEQSCYICDHYAETYERYMDTFFYLYKNDPEFRDKVQKSKGFCLPHFGDLCEAAETKLPDKEKDAFYNRMFTLMEENMRRVAEDVAWLVEKFDYRNKDADWKNSKDAIQRGMQKLKGGYPADPDYRMPK
ncbi:MAG: DUF6062 family protein [Clostridium sp.]|nr:DUF6062 family protein [Acetatifactor muris]MCM1527546.1 DUF6062 family protein [Bacteroides sp.]MCM1563788.1 DUF6062 family protein [Clostridium sp.]